MSQIGEGLAYAHRHGIVHGNLKTENLLSTSDGGVKITDFALIKLSAAWGKESRTNNVRNRGGAEANERPLPSSVLLSSGRSSPPGPKLDPDVTHEPPEQEIERAPFAAINLRHATHLRLE